MVLTFLKWLTEAQNEDEIAREKMAKRYEEMERRGQLGQKLRTEPMRSSADFGSQELYSFRTSQEKLNSAARRRSRGSKECLIAPNGEREIDTDLLRSDEKTFSYRQWVNKL